MRTGDVGDGQPGPSLRRLPAPPRYNRHTVRRSRVSSIATFALTLTLAGPTAPTDVAAQASTRRTGNAPRGADRITETQLRAYLRFVSSDLLEGRDTPSRGQDLAAAFLASHLERLGLRPAGDGDSYFQTLALTRRTSDSEKTTLSIGDRPLVYGEDFLPGEQPGIAEGSVVYVGNGTVLPSRGFDPYKGLDVRGKIVVTHRGLPTGIARTDLKGAEGVDWEQTEAAARRRGAVGILYLPDFPLLEEWTAIRERRRQRAAVTVDAFTARNDAPLPSATLGARAAAALFAGERVTGQEAYQRALRREPAAAFALDASRKVRLAIVTHEERVRAHNVVAVLDGSDPRLSQEYVAFGAHYDHLGVATPPTPDGDVIYNGADDDGSGTVGLLAMAEAFALTTPRPRRSLLFVWHTGEERGLWGARYFTEHPTVPLDRIVAQLNVDMIGRGRESDETASGPLALTDMNSVYVVGSRRLSTELGELVERVNAGYHRLRYDYGLDAPDDPARIYERSDHYHYAKHGIPIAFFFTGVHADYHGVDDEIERIDFPKYRRIVQSIYATGRALAEAPARPALIGAAQSR